MNFLRVSESVFVNSANILKLVRTPSGSVEIYMVGECVPYEVVSNNPEDAEKWVDWLASKTINISHEAHAK